jgi:hypothetical protein
MNRIFQITLTFLGFHCCHSTGANNFSKTTRPTPLNMGMPLYKLPMAAMVKLEIRKTINESYREKK